MTTVKTIGVKTSSHIEYGKYCHTRHHPQTRTTPENDGCGKLCGAAYTRDPRRMGDRTQSTKEERSELRRAG